MRDQHALGRRAVDPRIGLDRVGAAAHVGRHVGRHVAHAGMEHEVACAARGSAWRCRRSAARSGRRAAAPCAPRPGATIRRSSPSAARARAAARSSVSLKSRSRWNSSHLSWSKVVPGGWNATAFQPSCHRPRWPNISKYCGLAFDGAVGVREAAREARALDRHLLDAVDRRRRRRRRRRRAGSARGRWRGRTGAAARRARRCPWARTSPADRGCRRHGCSACSGAAACWPPSPSPAGSWNACRARRCRRCARSSPRAARGAGCRDPWH